MVLCTSFDRGSLAQQGYSLVAILAMWWDDPLWLEQEQRNILYYERFGQISKFTNLVLIIYIYFNF